MEVTAKELENTVKAKIVSYLKEYGEASVEALSGFLKLTPMAVRKHLNSLCIQGIITTKKLNKRVGRPIIIYFIHTKGQTHDFSEELLDAVKENYGNEVVIDLISKRSKKFYEKYKNRFLNKTLLEKIYETAEVFKENGFDTEIEEDKINRKIILKHKTCPILNTATKHDSICLFETESIETFIGVRVTRVCHFCSGGQACAYEILI